VSNERSVGQTNLKTYEDIIYEKSIHVDRVARGHRHNRDSGGDVAASSGQSQGEIASD
jgi:hypothetical protein